MDLAFLVRGRLRAVVVPLFSLSIAASPLSAQDPSAETSGEVGQLWADGVSKIAHGQFSQARESLARILESEHADENYLEIASWLDHRDKLNLERADLHSKQRAIYLKRARKNLGDGELSDALAWTKEAVDCSTAEPVFMRDTWVQEMHDKAVELAAEHEEKGEWTEAARLYYGLKLLYEGNPAYQRGMDKCLVYSRLEVIYGPDSNWQSRLRGITPRIVYDALWQIHGKYVAEVDFKSLAQRALARMLLLPESKSLGELFPALNEQDKRKQYVSRLQRLLRKVDRLEELTYSDLENDVFDIVIKINRQTIELPRELMIYEFVEGALADEDTLDQFTSMIWPADFAEFEKHTQGHFSGVGIQITLEDNQLTVVSPLEDTPAYHAGIQAGDKITHVDGQTTEGLSLTGVVQAITGPIGTDVEITVYRPGTKRTFDVRLRDDIRIQSVKGHRWHPETENWDFMIDSGFGIGYIRIGNFSESTTVELRKALTQLKQQGAHGLILDLRFNPGGLLRSAIEVSELFLPQDKLIVATDGLHSEPFSKSSQLRGKHNTLPMVVLVNESSAGASEIVSGALKDHHRALIVGERSFGKGSVQNLIPVGNTHAHLKLTTAHYYLPGGRCIHKLSDSDTWGVEPDVEVRLVPRERVQIRLMRRNADVIRTAGAAEGGGEESDSEASAESSKTPQQDSQPASVEPPDGAAEAQPGVEVEEQEPEEMLEYPEVDYQLETALLVIRVQLLQQLGFEILPKVKLGENTSGLPSTAILTN